MTSNAEKEITSIPTKSSTAASNDVITLNDDDDESPNKTPSQDPPQDPSIVPLSSRHTSAAWSHFTRKRVHDVMKAECNYCLKQLAGGPGSGTKHLLDHVGRCPKRKCRDIRQMMVSGSQKFPGDKKETMMLAPYEFRQEDGRRDLTEMIILHGYPISMVEHYGFRKYSKTLQPGFKVPCHNTTRKDIIKRYEEEKVSVGTLLRKSASRIALTTDMWTSNNQRKGYMVVTAHFIDKSWKLQSRILRFFHVPPPHNAEVLAEALKQCYESWNIDLNLSSITVDNCSTNDSMMEIVRAEMPRDALLLDGEFFHMRCCAHILNLIVQDGLSAVMLDGLSRIRDSVVFWTASEKRVQSFEKIAKLHTNCSKQLVLDCKTRWNSTYEMLKVAICYKEVFTILSLREKLYKNPPTNPDWEKVENICEHLKVFSIMTDEFSASKFPTANIYFPNICKLRISISGWLSSSCEYIRRMAQIMLEKYNKYWVGVSSLMAVAAVLDPRYKLQIVRFYYGKIFETGVDSNVNRVKDLLRELVAVYEAKHGRSQSSNSKSLGGSSCNTLEMADFLEFLQQDQVQENEQSDLDKYLGEKNVPMVDDFDVLNWWKTNGNNYPILQLIARDILSIPVSTVPSESAFSASGRVLDLYRSRIKSDLLEALMCAQSWIWANIKASGELKGKNDIPILVGNIEDGPDVMDEDSDCSAATNNN